MKLTSLFVAVLALVAAAQVAPSFAAEPFIEKQDLFTAGKDGYAIYRIPGMIVTAKGTVLAYCEARVNGKTDWDAIDILMRRSTDDGKTWSPRQKIADVPGPHKKNPMAVAQKLGNETDVTYNNAVGFADRDGTVHFLFCLEYMRCFYIRSDDDGVTFSKPVEITATFEKFRSEYDWKVLAVGPAHGIQTKTGRLVVPVWISLGTGGHAHRPSVAATIYSDDHGKTWLAGDIALPNTDKFVIPNETVIVELSNGQVMLNSRSESTAHRRIVTVSPDGATGWSKPRFDDALLEPICMASIVRFSARPVGDKNRILFANPHNLSRLDGKEVEGKTRDRRNLSVKVSYDEGKTWEVDKVLEPSYSAYSDLAVCKDGTILCLYETGQKSDEELKKPSSYTALTLARFNLEWLTDGKDSAAMPFDGKLSFGSKRDDFRIADADGFVVHPTKPAADGSKPWVWFAPTIGQHPNRGNAWLLTQLLDRGFYVAGCNVGEVFANPKSREQYAAFYRHVIDKYKLAPKACLIAQSRGGLFQYNLAADHPDWVQCIVGIFPVGDLRSFPTLKRAAPAYGMSEEQLEQELAKHNPIDRLEAIAKAKIPILHVHGDADVIVPIEKNSQVIYDRYTKLGGPMELEVVPGKGHEGAAEFFQSQRQLDFILVNAGQPKSAARTTFEPLPLAEQVQIQNLPVSTKSPPAGLVVRPQLGLITAAALDGDVVHRSTSRILETRATVTPNGDYLVMFPEGDHYAKSKGEKMNTMLAYRSMDKGVTWQGPTVAFDIPYSQHGFIPFIPRGSKRLYAFGTQPVPDKWTWENGQRENGPIGYRYSDDDGLTWSVATLIEPTNDPGFRGMSVMRMTETDAGTWLVGSHLADWAPKPFTTAQYLLRSEDKGKTWTVLPGARPSGWIAEGFNRMDEGRPLNLGGGRVLFMTRTPQGHLFTAWSNDDGKTWTEPVPSSLVHPDAPPMLFPLSNGRLAAFHHNKVPRRGNGDLDEKSENMKVRSEIWVSFSKDEGHSWSKPRFVMANAAEPNLAVGAWNFQCSYLDAFIEKGVMHLFMPHRWQQVLHLTIRESDLLKLPTLAELDAQASTKN